MTGRAQTLRGAALVLALLAAAPVVARDLIRPAELPPADYAGQQYVDSSGCLFVRAGTAAEVLWIPRVTRDGAPVCDNPPSGGRVPVVEEVGVQPVAAAPATTAAAAEGYFVAVASFAQARDADRAAAQLAKLKYDVVRGRVEGDATTQITVFAGPFADAEAATMALETLRRNGFPQASVIGP